MNPIQIPAQPLRLLSMLWEAGFQGYAVGGCVRDSLLGLSPNDWDLCTDALPGEMQQIFAGERTLDNGLKHGTLTVIAEEIPYEITTFRVDGAYPDHRHPETVRFVRDVREDLARRDFTVNAMAYHPKTGLVDTFGGEKDLREGVLRCVGNPEERFREDGLRVMRALRFSATYGLVPEKETDTAIRSCAALLDPIAKERIHTELCKLLLGKDRLRVLMQYPEVIGQILPELKPCMGFEQNNPHHCYDVYTHILHALDACPQRDLSLLFCLLLHDAGKPAVYTEDERGGHFYGHAQVSEKLAAVALARLRCSREVTQNALELIRWHDVVLHPTEKSIKRWLGRLGEEQFLRLLQVHRADISAQAPEQMPERLAECDAIEALSREILARGDCFSLRNLAITGNDLIQIGIPQGKKVGATLHSLLDRVIEGKIPNEREELLKEAIRQKGSKENSE